MRNWTLAAQSTVETVRQLRVSDASSMELKGNPSQVIIHMRKLQLFAMFWFLLYAVTNPRALDYSISFDSDLLVRGDENNITLIFRGSGGTEAVFTTIISIPCE